MKKILIFLKNELLYNGHPQTLGTVGIIVFSAIILKQAIPAAPIIGAYFLFYIIYFNDRLIDYQKDATSNKDRYSHIAKLKPYSPLIYFTCLTIPTYLLWVTNSNPVFITLNITVLVFGLIYPFWIKPLTKKIIAFKNLYVATVFALMVFWQAAYLYTWPPKTLLITALFVLVFLKAFTMQVFLDLKDLKTDNQNGYKTIPAKIGAKKTHILLTFSNLILFGSLFILFFITYNKILIPLVITVGFYAYFVTAEHLFNANSKFAKKMGLTMESAEFAFWPIIIIL